MKSTLALFLLLAFAVSAFSQEVPVIEPGRGVPNFLAKVQGGGKVHVAFLGGSITQNSKGHATLVPDWLRSKWPGVEFTVTNAGLASTGSVTGAFRFAEEVLEKGPVDLLVVEFAVNDDQDAMLDRDTAVRGLEGVVRQYFAANPTGDAISVQFVNPEILAKHQAGEEAVSVAAHKAVARHYGIASVDVGLALAREIAAGRMTWENDYRDTHPNETGYRFASGLIEKVIDESKASAEPVPVALPEPLDLGSYDRVSRLDPQALSWLGGWKFGPVSKDLLPVGSIRGDYLNRPALRSDSADDYLYHTFAGSTLAAFVLAGPDAGVVEVSVDGGDWRKIDLFHHHSKALNYPRTVLLAEGLSGTYHSIAIRTSEKRNPKSEGNTATFLSFGVAE